MTYTYTEMKVYNLVCDECQEQSEIITTINKRTKDYEKELRKNLRHLTYCKHNN